MNYMKIIPETITDGEGLRTSIYVAGCTNRCKGCFNPESWPYDAGKPLTDDVINNIIEKVNKNPLLEGVSILGGDPFAPKNRKGLLELLEKLSAGGISNVWVWTGYTIEELRTDAIASGALQYISTLIDGPYVEALRDPTLSYRGSSNQRILKISS